MVKRDKSTHETIFQAHKKHTIVYHHHKRCPGPKPIAKEVTIRKIVPSKVGSLYYSAHRIYKPPSVIRVAVAIGSAAALSRGWI